MLKKNAEEWVFGEYSFKEYWMYTRITYLRDFGLLPNEEVDYSHLIKGVLKVMEIEGVNFEGLVTNYGIIAQGYHNGGQHFEQSQKYNLMGATISFSEYLKYIRMKRMSVDGFRDFLVQETIDNEVYLSNKCDEGESLVAAICYAKKRPIRQLKKEHISLYIEKTKNILVCENIDIQRLAVLSSCGSKTEVEDRYPDYDEPTTGMVLEWLARYYKKTIQTV